MTNSFKYIIPIVIGVTLALGIFLGSSLNKPVQSSTSYGSSAGGSTKKLSEILTILDNEYVDSIDKAELFEQAISDMLHDLDPHSNYIPASQLQAMNESIEGRFGGVGVRFTIIRDTLCITNVIPNSPSERAGVHSQDQILKIDSVDISTGPLSNKSVMEKLKGLEGTDVEVTILRDGKKLKKTITRGSIPINSVLASYMIDENIGYIQLNEFSLTSSREFLNAAAALKSQGMKQLIFDLRFNGGGVLEAAVQICDMFLEKGLPIVSTRGKNQPNRIKYSVNTPIFDDVELAILVNSSSASASEIVAGAIQDNDRGIIVGRRTFGKGLVQQDMPLKDSSNLRLTIARYYTPTGRSIQRSYANGYDDYMMEERDRYTNGELYAPDSTLMVDSLKFTTPKGKTVYGGGGIMPDYFVAFDTTGTSYYMTRMQYAKVFSDFAFDYVKAHPGLKTKYLSYKKFDATFEISDELLNTFVSYADKYYEIKPDSVSLKTSKTRIKNEIKTRIASQIWLENGAQYVRMKNDSEIQKAVALFK